MDSVQVTFRDLYDASDRLRRGAGQIDAELSSMKTHLTTLGASWMGAASQEFDRLFQEWDRNARALHENLDGISRILRTAGENYEETERRNKQAFTQ